MMNKIQLQKIKKKILIITIFFFFFTPAEGHDAYFCKMNAVNGLKSRKVALFIKMMIILY